MEIEQRSLHEGCQQFWMTVGISVLKKDFIGRP
jgi:hypothetical protein